MEDVFHAGHRPSARREIGEVPLENSTPEEVRQVLALSGDEAVDDANAVAAAHRGLPTRWEPMKPAPPVTR